MTTGIIVAVMLACFAAVLTFIKGDHAKKFMELHKQIENLRQENSKLMGAKAAAVEEEAQKEETKQGQKLMQGLVTKQVVKRGNRTATNFVLNSLPEFKTVDEAVNYGLGLFTPVDDPTEINLVGLGNMTKTENYIALRLVAQGILYQISKLDAEDTAQLQ